MSLLENLLETARFALATSTCLQAKITRLRVSPKSSTARQTLQNG